MLWALIPAVSLTIAWADDTPKQANPSEISLGQCLAIAAVGRGGRSPFHTDAIEAKIVAGRWQPPNAGDEVKLPDGSARRWESLKAGNDGSFSHASLRGGYAYFAVPSAESQVMLLEANGHGMVYVNGQPRTGDPYGTGYVRLPVQLKKGTNDLLFQVGRGRLQAKLVEPKSGIMFDTRDQTLPDLIVGETVDTWGAILVTNATTSAADELRLEVVTKKDEQKAFDLPPLLPLSTRKIGFRIVGQPPVEVGAYPVKLLLTQRAREKAEDAPVGKESVVLDTAIIDLKVCKPEQTHRRTFVSQIDGSVQYYGIVPCKDRSPEEKPALVLTLHGAAVEGIGQAACYSPKPGIHVVAPTNRRPYGFDWEDWGRVDALEVLELEQKRLNIDPRRVYLTGHSMGGHGTWHIGVTYPDRFAAIGPSAGWISMSSYAGARRADNPDPVTELVQRAASPSDTLALKRNYAMHGVYVLHGDKDDNVPVAQARTMRRQLGEFHPDFVYHEQPGAGHWWGNACVDWPPMIEFFQQRTLPERRDVREVDFTTASPGISASCHWLSIEAQDKPMKPSSVHLQFDPQTRRFSGTTENVARAALDLGHLSPGEPIQVEFDKQKLDNVAWPTGESRLWFGRDQDKWSVIAKPDPTQKGPHRYGPFREAFGNRMVFVYGTAGTPDENAWSLAKARYDAETFWYRGNGSIDVVADSVFNADADRERNVVVYGNADTNRVWNKLLGDSPVQIGNGGGRIGDREISGDDLACLFVRPRPGSDRALVGVVSGTGAAGMRLTDRIPYFVSGIALPDCVVVAPSVLVSGNAGPRAAGYFGLDWSVARGEFAWRD